VKRKPLTFEDYLRGIETRDRTVLGRAISLIESQAAAHHELATRVLRAIMPKTGNSIRVGITGAPGVGKSTLIEQLGLRLIEQGHNVAVLAIDPTSSLSGGSILGDKTRMDHLARNQNAFIRPSPSGGALGGVARKTRETMLLCEAAGYDVIIVETVGVGQNEIAVRSMVDFFLLLQIPGAGDELQGIKKGIIEICDAIFINKADGEHQQAAELARQELNTALHYLAPATAGWETRAYTCSALTGAGIDTLWATIEKFKETTMERGLFKQRRRQQAKKWLTDMVNEYLQRRFWEDETVKATLAKLEAEVESEHTPPTVAAQTLVELFEQQFRTR